MFHKTIAILLTVTLITATMPARVLAAQNPAPAAATETPRPASTFDKIVGLGFIFGTLGMFPSIAVMMKVNPKIGAIMLGVSAGTAILSGLYCYLYTTPRDANGKVITTRSEVLTAPAQPSSSETQTPPVARGPSDIVDMDELRVTE